MIWLSILLLARNTERRQRIGIRRWCISWHHSFQPKSYKFFCQPTLSLSRYRWPGTTNTTLHKQYRTLRNTYRLSDPAETDVDFLNCINSGNVQMPKLYEISQMFAKSCLGSTQKKRRYTNKKLEAHSIDLTLTYNVSIAKQSINGNLIQNRVFWPPLCQRRTLLEEKFRLIYEKVAFWVTKFVCKVSKFSIIFQKNTMHLTKT